MDTGKVCCEDATAWGSSVFLSHRRQVLQDVKLQGASEIHQGNWEIHQGT